MARRGHCGWRPACSETGLAPVGSEAEMRRGCYSVATRSQQSYGGDGDGCSAPKHSRPPWCRRRWGPVSDGSLACCSRRRSDERSTRCRLRVAGVGDEQLRSGDHLQLPSRVRQIGVDPQWPSTIASPSHKQVAPLRHICRLCISLQARTATCGWQWREGSSCGAATEVAMDAWHDATQQQTHHHCS